MGHESKAEKYAHNVRLKEGVRGLVDAWEADIFREKSLWTAREQQRAALTSSVVQWLNEEVVSTGGVIGEYETYVDNLAVEISEQMADDDLSDALERLSNEQEEVTKLARRSIHYTEKLLDAPDEKAQDELLEATRKQAAEDAESVLSSANPANPV